MLKINYGYLGRFLNLDLLKQTNAERFLNQAYVDYINGYLEDMATVKGAEEIRGIQFGSEELVLMYENNLEEGQVHFGVAWEHENKTFEFVSQYTGKRYVKLIQRDDAGYVTDMLQLSESGGKIYKGFAFLTRPQMEVVK